MLYKNSSTRWALVIFCVLLVLQSRWPPTAANPDPEQAVSMTEALKYLQALDKYYSQVARPRTRKDAQMDENGDVLKLLHLLHLDRRYSRLARPRFGRSLPLRSPEMDVSAESEAERFYSQRRR